ncbi:MAG TPA: hypothetical protein VF797_02735 [Noviherbaspirillum sp.]
MNKDEALLWQVNAFVQAERKHLPEDVDVIFHAKKSEHINSSGTKVSSTDLYLHTRPKLNAVSSFFDSLIHWKEQKLAADILLPLIKRAATACPSVNSTSAPRYRDPSNQSQAQQASVQVDSIASSLKAVADRITADKLEPPGNNGPLVKQRVLQDAVRAQPEFSQWDANVNTLSDSDLRKTLEGFGFKAEGITTFKSIADAIAGNGNIGNIPMAALHEFWMTWVATCNRADEAGEAGKAGRNFRKTVCSHPQLRAWNVLAHHLARQTQPKFDLSAYATYTRVMVPDIDDMIWTEASQDHGASHAIAKKLHAKARATIAEALTAKAGGMRVESLLAQAGEKVILECEPTPDNKHQLFAAYGKFFRSKPDSLSAADEAYLSNAYAQFINQGINAGESILLTPLFDYEAATIEACMATVLAPIDKALQEGKRLPDIGFFSTDPRITTKFNEELDKLKMQAQLRKIRAAIQQPTYPTLESKVPEPVVIPTLTAPPTQTLKVQVGITDNHWYPNDKTLLLLTSSSRDCVPQKEVFIAIELDQILESDDFSAAQEGGAIFSAKQKPMSQGSAARYVAPVKEVATEENKWFFSAAALDESKAKEIQMAYKKVCVDAEAIGIYKLVMTPCFREVGTTMLGNNKPYREAIGIMVETLAHLSRTYPKLELTMVARSEHERVLMQEAMKNQGVAID